MIITRYILREVVLTLAAVAGVLYLIFVSNRFIRLLADAEAGKLPSEIVFQLLALKSLSNTSMLVPLALFFSVLLALGRLYKDNEMVALAACGVGTGRMLRILLLFALLFAVPVGFVSLELGPWAEEKSYQLQEKAEAAGVGSLAGGQFREVHDGDTVFYVEDMAADGRTLRNIFLETRRAGMRNVLTAARGHQYTDPWTGDRYLVLLDGYRYEGEPGSPRFKILRFKEHGVLIEERRVEPASRRLAAISSGALLEQGTAAALAEFQWRVSLPLAAVLLALFAVPLSRTTPRQGRYARLFAAVLIYVVYINLLAASRSWVERGVLPPAIGMWWVHAALLFVMALLLARQYGLKAWMPRLVKRVSP